MFCYIVALDSDTEGSRILIQQRLVREKAYCPISKTTWAVKTPLSAQELFSKLSGILKPSEKLLILRSGTEATWINYPPTYSDWFKRNF